MSTKTRSTTAEIGTTEVAEGSRNNLANFHQANATMLRTAGAIQQVNLQMLQRVALSQQQAADKLRQAGSPSELLAAQVTLVTAGMGEAMQYVHELTQATMAIQGELHGGGQPAMPAAMAASPMMQAWQSMFTTPLNGGAAAQTH